jgi:hypothetical protein
MVSTFASTTAIAAAWTRGFIPAIESEDGYMLIYEHLEDVFDRLKNHKGKHSVRLNKVGRKDYVIAFNIEDGKIPDPPGDLTKMMAESIY